MSKSSYTDEYYVQKARNIGLRARSYFKLEEIDKKFSIFSQISSFEWILDLGCSPGSWIQYCLKHTKNRIIGIDLQNTEPFSEYRKRVYFLKKDIGLVDQKEITVFTKGEKERKISLIMSDMAPKTTGNTDLDSYISYELVLKAWEIAKKNLNVSIKNKAFFIAKYFQGCEKEELLKQIRQEAKVFFMNKIPCTVKLFKPQSSRKNSREIFIIVIWG